MPSGIGRSGLPKKSDDKRREMANVVTYRTFDLFQIVHLWLLH